MNNELSDELRMIQGVIFGLDSVSEQLHGRPQMAAGKVEVLVYRLKVAEPKVAKPEGCRSKVAKPNICF